MTGALPRDRGWRVTHSLWLLPSLLCCGFTSWAGFLYIGVRTKNRVWLMSAFAYFAGAVLAVVMLSLSGPTDEEVAAGAAPPTRTQENLSDWGAGFMIALWMAGIVHSLLARPHYLYALDQQDRTRSAPMPLYPNPIQQQSAHTWLTGDTQQYWTPSPAPAPTAPPVPGYEPTVHARNVAPAPPMAEGVRPGTASPGDDYASTIRRPSARPDLDPPAAPQWFSVKDDTVSASNASDTPVAVNTASAQEFSKLGLTDEAVAAIVEYRSRTGGFRDLPEFANAAGLKPHELSRVTGRLDFSGAPPAPNRSFGRRLDL